MKNTMAISLMLLCSLSSNVWAEIYQFQPDQVEIDVDTQQQRHQLHPAGFAEFKHNVRVPVFNVSVLNPVKSGLLFPKQDCKKGCQFKMTLDPSIAKQMKIYHIGANGFYLVPEAWQSIEANMGVNGDLSLIMQSDDGNANLMVYQSAACISCALSHAAILFPAAARDYAAEYDIEYSGNNANLNIIYPEASTAYFDYQIAGRDKTHGVARYQHHPDRLYDSMRVTLPAADKAMARAMLNFFLLQH